MYEIFVCEQAVLFAERWKNSDKLKRWRCLNYEHQLHFMPELEEAGHSNNSFGAAYLLALLYLDSPEKVPELWGALAPLVGSDAYLPAEERQAITC